jgi:hypothetical protein
VAVASPQTADPSQARDDSIHHLCFDRTLAVETALAEKLDRLRLTRLARECAILDPERCIPSAPRAGRSTISAVRMQKKESAEARVGAISSRRMFR